MKFTSLQEYFYKLQNVLYILILVPLIAFIFLIASQPEKVVPLGPEETPIIMSLLIGIATLDWVVVSFIFAKAMASIRKATLLSTKLDRYYVMTLIRYAVMTSSCLIMALGYYLTDDVLFLVLFGVAVILYFLLWPRTGTVCRHLKLKGDEYEMVLYKKDSF